jgi:hypothetical protein
MDEDLQIRKLKELLVNEVARLCGGRKTLWKRPISATLEEIKRNGWSAVFFGGTLRSLLLDRLERDSPGRPRDIDIVLKDVDLNALRQSFDSFLSRETRFGGLQLRRREWQFDLWPLHETHLIKHDRKVNPTFDDLPTTTFFNIEAIAVEVWPRAGRQRRIFSGDDQFFRGILHKTIEINRIENPFPELCVVRAIVMAANSQWRIGPRLSRFLAEEGAKMSPAMFVELQRKHYGRVQWLGEFLPKAIALIQTGIESDPSGSAILILPKQLTFWPEDLSLTPRLHLHLLRRLRHRKASKN